MNTFRSERAEELIRITLHAKSEIRDYEEIMKAQRRIAANRIQDIARECGLKDGEIKTITDAGCVWVTLNFIIDHFTDYTLRDNGWYWTCEARYAGIKYIAEISKEEYDTMKGE